MGSLYFSYRYLSPSIHKNNNYQEQKLLPVNQLVNIEFFKNGKMKAIWEMGFLNISGEPQPTKQYEQKKSIVLLYERQLHKNEAFRCIIKYKTK